MIETFSPKQYKSPTALWKSICSLEGETFCTSGRGSRPGTPFTYTISRTPGRGGRHYNGESIPGYGNEMWVTTFPSANASTTQPSEAGSDGSKSVEAGKPGARKSKSISRSTVDKAYETVLEKQRAGEKISGPKSLNVYGASYIWPIFVDLRIITLPQSQAASSTPLLS